MNTFTRRNSVALMTALIWTLAAATSGCSMTQFAADSTVEVMKAGNPAVAEESDPRLAKMGLEGNLKLMEGLMYATPDNAALYRLATEAFGSYGFGFLEPMLWTMAVDDPARESHRLHIKTVYERALRYGKRLVELTDEDMHAALSSQSQLAKALSGEVDRETLEALYWVAQALGQLVSIDPEDLENLADMGIADLIMAKIAKDHPSYEDGGAATFIGTNLSVKGKGLAGDMAPAKKSFEAAIAVSGGKYLLPLFLKGRWYCEAIDDRACFEKTLKAVIGADPNAWKQRRLTNLLAQRWARHWLARAAELF